MTSARCVWTREKQSTCVRRARRFDSQLGASDIVPRDSGIYSGSKSTRTVNKRSKKNFTFQMRSKKKPAKKKSQPKKNRNLFTVGKTGEFLLPGPDWSGTRTRRRWTAAVRIWINWADIGVFHRVQALIVALYCFRRNRWTIIMRWLMWPLIVENFLVPILPAVRKRRTLEVLVLWASKASKFEQWNRFQATSYRSKHQVYQLHLCPMTMMLTCIVWIVVCRRAETFRPGHS